MNDKLTNTKLSILLSEMITYRQSLNSLRAELTDINAYVNNIIRDICKIKGVLPEELKISNLPVLIVTLVNDEYKLNVCKQTKSGEHPAARATAAYLLKKYTDLSLLEISGYIGVNGHTAAISNLKRHKELSKTSPTFVSTLVEIENKLNNLLDA